jgi:transposase
VESAEETTPGRRRSASYPLAFKRQLAQRTCGENVSVAQLTLEHGLNSNMVFKWRRELRTGRLDSATALLLVTPDRPPGQSKSAADGVIEIRIRAAVARIEGAPILEHLALSFRVFCDDRPACRHPRLACRRRHRHAFRLQRPGGQGGDRVGGRPVQRARVRVSGAPRRHDQTAVVDRR